MSTHITEVSRRLQHIKEVCRRAGLKFTHQRMVIFDTVARATDHPNAEAVYAAVREQIPTVSLDTVYRTLALLVEFGLIEKLCATQETMRFDGNMAPHHHFICTRCGATHDFYSEPFDTLVLPDDVQALGRVQKVQVEVRGVCRRCAQDDQPEQPEASQE